jgi:hypothetical protein
MCCSLLAFNDSVGGSLGFIDRHQLCRSLMETRPGATGVSSTAVIRQCRAIAREGAAFNPWSRNRDVNCGETDLCESGTSQFVTPFALLMRKAAVKLIIPTLFCAGM